MAHSAGRALPEVRAILGHKDIKLTLRYAYLAPEHLRAAAASVDDVIGLFVELSG